MKAILFCPALLPDLASFWIFLFAYAAARFEQYFCHRLAFPSCFFGKQICTTPSHPGDQNKAD